MSQENDNQTMAGETTAGETTADTSRSSQTPDRPGLMFWIRLLVAAAVIVALVLMVRSSANQLQAADFRPGNLRPAWLLAGIICYLISMTLSCGFWHRVLLALGQQPQWRRSLLAFFTSQLGKYVPGKAMVVLVRTDLIRGKKVDAATAAASVFVETLSWIFVGSVIASVLIAVNYREQKMLGITAVGLAIAAGVLTWPPVFRWIAGLVLKRKSKSVSDAPVVQLSGLNFSTMGAGWFILTIAWCFNGMSLWMVVKSLHGTGITISDFPLTLLCVSLATVAGFVSLLPGGLGVRELVIIPLLGTRFSTATALIAAVVIRLIWLASEFIASAIIYLLEKRKMDPGKPGKTAD